MAKGKRKVVWFSYQNDKDIFDFLKKQGNFSKYIKKLIQRDMKLKQQGIDEELLQYIDKIIESRLSQFVLVTKHEEVTDDTIYNKLDDYF